MPDPEEFMHDVIKQISEERANDSNIVRGPFSFMAMFVPLFTQSQSPSVYTTQVISRPRTPGVFP